MIRKFRKKPVVIEAMQVPTITPDDPKELALVEGVGRICGWFMAHGFEDFEIRSMTRSIEGTGGHPIAIKTLEGEMLAMPGDWIIRGVAGEFYPCKPEIFAATYEESPNDQP